MTTPHHECASLSDVPDSHGLNLHLSDPYGLPRPCAPGLAECEAQSLSRAFALVGRASARAGGALARQAATALYNVVTLAAMRAEAADAALASRAHLADRVLLDRLAPYDPCMPPADDVAGTQALMSVIDSDAGPPENLLQHRAP